MEDKCCLPTLPALFYRPDLLGAAVSLFNLGQTDGDGVCGDCINISNPVRDAALEQLTSE